jgi:hypothetical protein
VNLGLLASPQETQPALDILKLAFVLCRHCLVPW